LDNRKRQAIQALSTLLHNANLKGFLTGKLYTGPLKQICVPGLNCYSCPGAAGACPLGSLQNALAARTFRLPYYVLGLLVFFGALLGRAVCGFLCPFGWLQELLYRVPFFRKINRFRGDRKLRLIKYAVLVLLVVVLPLCFTLIPFFCKYLCPAGTFAGILLAVYDKGVRAQLGGIFLWKLSLLVLIVLGSLMIFRFFCKYLCPLGAIYGCFNRVSLLRLQCDSEKCIHCGRCAAACGMCVDPVTEPDSPECIRCGQCVTQCPEQALILSFRKKQS